jgi:tetratricopeptide (TPR) repeat protein
MKLDPDLPSPAQFDHVITVVPRGNDVIWLDSTPEIGPYRMLIYPLRDKQALVIPTSGAATLMRTPKDPPFPSLVAFESNGKLDKDGTYTGHISLKMRGDAEIIYREIFHQTPRPQWNDVAQRVSQSLGYAGTVSNLDVSSPERTTGAFQYSYDYTRKEYSDWANRRISPALLPVSFPSADDDDKPSDVVLLGAPHVETMQSVMELPPDYTVVLPKSVKYSTDFATYQADYRLDGKKLIAERRFEVLAGKVPVSKWEDYQKFVKNVQEDENRFIQLTASGMEAAAEEEISNPDAERPIQEAFIDMQNNNFEAARSALDQAEKLNPRQLGLWMGYGSLQWCNNNNMDDALANFKKEVSLHPGNPRVYRALAQIQMSYKRYDDAEASLRSLLKLVPNNSSAEMQLGNLLLQQKKYKEAAAVLTPAQKAAPDNKVLAIQAGRAQLFAGDRAAGEATLKAMLDGATDPGLLNDAAYELADAGLDLDLAESSCKKAVEKLESQTAQVSLTNLRNSDLGQINLLIATWDTMGWIYFRQGNLPLAESYVRAAWMQGQHREVGDHLGQIYEKEGKKQEAANIYALAAASGRITPDPAGRTTMEDRIEEVEDVQFIRGDDALKSAGDALRKGDFHMPFPKDSKAKLVRRGILACTPAMEKCQFTLLLPQTTTTQ